MNPLLTKEDMYRRWMAMEFGNRPQAWHTYSDWDVSGYTGPVSLRYSEPDSTRKVYDVQPRNVLLAMHYLGGDPAQYRISEHLPDEEATFRGELTTDVKGLWLLWGTGSAMANLRGPLGPTCRGEGGPARAEGMDALGLLKRHLDPVDREDLMGLVKDYPDHTIEFSAYRRRVGVCNRRMVVWEVRKY